METKSPTIHTEMMVAMFGVSEQELTSLLALYAYWVVLVFVTVESMGVPVPGESILLATSIYAGTTHRRSRLLLRRRPPVRFWAITSVFTWGAGAAIASCVVLVHTSG
ncbi:MAG: hypothetical protein PVSMB7_03940 [Chloroflexota bacterium]